MMLVVIVGGWELYYVVCGINGLMDDLLFFIYYGILYYFGFEVLLLFVVYCSGWIDVECFVVLSE